MKHSNSWTICYNYENNYKKYKIKIHMQHASAASLHKQQKPEITSAIWTFYKFYNCLSLSLESL